MKKIILAGGSGFLGQALAAHFIRKGHAVTVLTRSAGAPISGVHEMFWDGCTLGGWCRELESAAAVINLTGRSVNCRYHERNRSMIMDSRIRPTRIIGEAIAKCQTPPAVWLNTSTATIYQHTYGPAWDENGNICGIPEARDEFSVKVAMNWESCAERSSDTSHAKSRPARCHGFGP
jgi:NAD dependent epimerase/dehydratase family enzyme